MGEEGMRRRDFLRAGAGVAAGAFVAGCGVGPQSAPPAVVQAVVKPKIDGDLLIFNWTEYMNPKVIKRFEKQYGVKVTVSNFDSMPSMMAKLQAGNQYDLIFPTADYVNRLNRRNALRPLDRAALKNSGGIYPFFDDPWYDKDSAHTVPYGMYTTGIAWREDKVGDLTGSWGDLANEKAKGRIFMLDDFQEAIGQANLFNGFELNTVVPEELEQTKETLQHEKDYLRGYSTNPAPNLVSGTAWIHHAWNGDVVNARNQSKNPENLRFQTCKEGIPVGSDCMAIPVQREAPGHGDAVHRLDARSRERGGERVVVRLSDADQGHRGRVRRAGLERPASRSRRSDLDNGQQFRELDVDGKKAWDRDLDGGEGMTDAFWRRFLIPGALWLLFFFLVPFGIAVLISLGENNDFGGVTYGWNPSNYADALDPLFAPVLLRSVGYAAATAALCLLIGYPVAYCIARFGGRRRNLLIAAILAPFLVNYLVRTYAWVALLADEGLVNGVITDSGFCRTRCSSSTRRGR